MRAPTTLRPECEFHVSRRARERYGFDLGLFSSTGNVVFADFHAARLFADRMNAARDLASHPELAVRASEINALGLIDEMLHVILARYRERVRPRLFADALAELEAELGAAAVDRVLAVFVDEFPPLAVYRGELDVAAYLAGSSGGRPHREVALEELTLLRLANTNPAFGPFRELFDDDRLRRDSAYETCIRRLEASLAQRSGFPGDGQTLLDLLLGPVRAAPTSLEGQLAFIRGAWAAHLGGVVLRVLTSLGFVAEESRPWFGPGPGPVRPPDWGDLGDAPERYSADRDWMPRLVLLAKNAHVWLAQLSRRHGRDIATLDAVPDSELDRLAGWGFTGLWLIGVWKRSRASETIKRWMGDHDAVASAYSIADYSIADDLGGEAAYDDLRSRAWARGIRLSTDMVPNHMGIDSRWVIEHPDWFIGLDRSPFPGYRFTGADLCDDGRVGVYLEDGYWRRSDAAVVFKRVDHWTGAERFIYHGNDGTSMPWNDTAQLDYRRADLREAVIQTILHVARRSPIIRFDAAMTLAKQHYHRLWFPEPGTGGDIPSRAEHGMTRAAFDEVMPEEFWREVVDRVAAEAPDTLLLAEAFWLLEGYFVRTLGMHRVYNSAFMNMLRDERNADYRLLIKSTLEYDPQILKRYVNFMSNPDERTAIDQFGADGKYIGVATLMATLPGLPMFGHGQVEGYAEKYGMEFRRPRWEETPDDGLVSRHERQIFPLLRRRGSFAEVDRFLLFDLEDQTGRVDENVFAYSNEVGGVRSLVIYHNAFAETAGWLRRSTAKLVRSADGSERLERFDLAVGLGLADGDGSFVAFRDVASGLEYLRSCRRLRDEGLFVELDAYRCHVFVDFRDLADDAEGRLRRLEAELGGRGTDGIDLALLELEHRDVFAPLAELIAAEGVRSLVDAATGEGDAATAIGGVLDSLAAAATAVAARFGQPGDPDEVVLAVRRDLERALALGATNDAGPPPSGETGWWTSLLVWLLLRRLGDPAGPAGPGSVVARWFDEWRLDRMVSRQTADFGLGADGARRAAETVRLLLELEGWWVADDHGAVDPGPVVAWLLSRDPGASFLGVNVYDEVTWYSAEAFAELIGWLRAVAAIESWSEPLLADRIDDALARLESASAGSGFRVATLLAALEGP
ncbi:MAG: alpha-amylase family glycosyl hydrolase [Thermoanaerobaculales bacterium]|jgi:glycosidase|nr:alpha-amylase family glycosyl hydrolase [Thermoanaerobaculales bacterium]